MNKTLEFYSYLIFYETFKFGYKIYVSLIYTSGFEVKTEFLI